LIKIEEPRIPLIRGHKVMLSTDLAELYEVDPRVLVQAVKRNLERFPGDFMFQLTRTEHANLKSQSVISSWGGARRAPGSEPLTSSVRRRGGIGEVLIRRLL